MIAEVRFEFNRDNFLYFDGLTEVTSCELLYSHLINFLDHIGGKGLRFLTVPFPDMHICI